jgi:8-oxo-dGTP diphosphatase
VGKKMLAVNFYSDIEDELLKFAVIVSKSNNQWVFCKHKQRNTYEVPGGHREPNETILETARRELQEETGAVEYDLQQVCVYSVTGDDGVINNEEETYGMLFFADIKKFAELPDFEMEQVVLFDDLPTELTYPLIQPMLMEKVKQILLNED